VNNDPKLSYEQIELVKQTWAKVVPIAEIASELFYQRLFHINPELKLLFDGVDLPSQRSKLIKAINTVVMSLDHIDTMIPMISDLGKRHVNYGVEEQHYQQVGEALLWTLKTGLKNAWSEEVKIAWTNAYQLLAEVMVNGAREYTLNAA